MYPEDYELNDNYTHCKTTHGYFWDLLWKKGLTLDPIKLLSVV